MAAYLIADIEVLDADAFGDYRKQVPAVIAAHGGKYLARGGPIDVLEGTWNPARGVIVEFPTMAALRGFYDAPEYRALRELRQRTTRSKLVALEGL